MIHTFSSEVHLPGLVLPVTSICIRENSKSILISPIGFSSNEIQQLKSSGGVTDIIAPTLIHHKYVQKAKTEFPKAKLWGVEGFSQKKPEINWDEFVTKSKWPYADFLEVLEIQGMPELNEVVFFHKNTKTLIVADLCFNLQSPKGFLAPFFLRILGTYRRFNISLFLLKYIKDKAEFKKSMEDLMKWDFEQIVMSHGAPIRKDAKEKLKKALKARGLIDA